MNNLTTFLVVLLAIGFLMVGCSMDTPPEIEPVAEAHIDAACEDEWDDDAPNWQHPDDPFTAVTTP